MSVPVPRRFLAVIEPLVSAIFFSPEPAEEYQAIGLDGWQAYFCSRSAAMGAVDPSVVAATFYNFNPELVRASVRWDIASPEAVLAARHRGVTRMLTRLLEGGDGPPAGLARAIELLREATAACRPDGRPLFAAHARLPWPEENLLGLWHGANLLREYRGDGHIAVLLAHQVDAVEAILLHAAHVGSGPRFLQATRAWDDDTLAAGAERLAVRGFMTPERELTDAGQKFRLMLESETDRLATPPFAVLGPDRSEELLAVLTPLAQGMIGQQGVPRGLGRMDPANKLA
jgi:hypothetical protein